jgi:hypothetical protein
MFQDEMLWAWFGPERREAINQTLSQTFWGKTTAYVPGGDIFEMGLFDWELRAIAEPPFPRSGRILLGGAGGGRELVELCRRGFDVVAFEPSGRLCESARQVIASFPRADVVQASYRDLVNAANEHAGPLAPHVLNTSFDAIFFGWASFNFALADLNACELLSAARLISPQAPILLSVGMSLAETGRLGRLRRVLRRINKLLGAPSARRPGDYWCVGGFGHLLSEDEFISAVRDSGYRLQYSRRFFVSLFDERCAILTPQ